MVIIETNAIMFTKNATMSMPFERQNILVRVYKNSFQSPLSQDKFRNTKVGAKFQA